MIPEPWLTVVRVAAAVVATLLALLTSAHAVAWKRDPRSALGWTVFIFVAPVLGAAFYLGFGVNRVQRRAVSRRRLRGRLAARQGVACCSPEDTARMVTGQGDHLVALARLGGAVTGRPLAPGNAVAALENGEQAYPVMLDAIERAEVSVGCETYILGDDDVGRMFIDALARAASRGVQVRMLVDDLGGGRRLERRLAPIVRAGGRAAAFHPLGLPLRTHFHNLRNHRKILVVDGRLGFTGGMNLRATQLVASSGADAEQDVHFRLEGPVVEHLVEAFVDDWAYTTRETLDGERWFPSIAAAGDTLARAVPYDPGMQSETVRLLWSGAIACAQRSVRIVTPYFLPDQALLGALNVAALRGVSVDIVMPERTDWVPVTWATTAMLWQALEWGCRAWRTPAPFDHAKLVVVDDAWSFFGSPNWDQRSLRLNFELGVECYDPAVAARVAALVDARRAKARQVTLADVDARSFPIRVRDGAARLAWPYL